MRFAPVAEAIGWAWFIWLPLGLTRLTQLALFDRIFDAPRKWWLKKVNPCNLRPGDPGLGLLGYLSMCIFCMSVDIGIVVFALLGIPATRDATIVLLAVLSASYLVPLLNAAQDFGMSKAPDITDDMRAAWDHGGTCVEPEPEPRDETEAKFDQILGDLEDLPDDHEVE